MRMLARNAATAAAAAVCYMVAAGTCLAQEDTNNQALFTGGDSGSTLWMLMKVLFFLAVIIGIFIVIIRVIAQKNRMYQAGRSIKSIGGLGLGTNKSVQVVQIGNSLYVLGVGEDVSLISQIEDPEEIHYITEHLHTSSVSGDLKGFPTVGEWLRRLRGKQSHAEELVVEPSFQAVFQEKMNRMTSRQKKVEELMVQDQESLNERLNDK